MNYLLDTCILSELIKPVPNGKVLKWFETVQADQLYVSVLTIGELREGITRLPQSKKKDRLALWLETILTDYRSRILPITLEIAENWGLLHGQSKQKGRTIPAIDGLIASTSLTHNLTLVTRNIKDFDKFLFPLHNPWE